MLAAWPEEDQGLPEITARPSNRAGRYFVLRSSSCSLSEICGRTSNKITRWPSKFTTPRSTPGTHTPRQWTQFVNKVQRPSGKASGLHDHTVIISNRGRAESEALTRALSSIAAAGLRTHCSDPETHHYWVSDHH